MILPMASPNVALSNLFEDLAKIVGLSKTDPESYSWCNFYDQRRGRRRNGDTIDIAWSSRCR